MVSQNILAGTLLSLSLAAASLVPLQQLPDVGLMARNLELITPKVFILNGVRLIAVLNGIRKVTMPIIGRIVGRSLLRRQGV